MGSLSQRDDSNTCKSDTQWTPLLYSLLVQEWSIVWMAEARAECNLGAMYARGQVVLDSKSTDK